MVNGQEWVIDVIDDLRTFAEQNGLPLLAAQLNATTDVARSEISYQQRQAAHAVENRKM